MRTMKIGLAAILLAGGVASAAEGFELDGIRVGMAESDVRAVFRNARCSTPKGTAAIDRECVVETPSSDTTKRYYFIFLEGRLVTATMYFPASGYDEALKATQSKYGRPVSLDMKTVPDREGGELQSSIATWRVGLQALSLERYTTIRPTHSALELKDELQYDIVDQRIRKRSAGKSKP